MTVFSWNTPGTLTSILTTQLDALANAQYTVVSADIDNETGKHLYLAVELVLPSLAVAAGGYWQLFAAVAVDSTPNFEDFGAGGATVPPMAPIAVVPLLSGTSAKRSQASNILIPPFHFKLAVGNQSGVAFAGTLNTLKYRLYDELGT